MAVGSDPEAPGTFLSDSLNSLKGACKGHYIWDHIGEDYRDC